MSQKVAVSLSRWLACSIACVSLMSGIVAEGSVPSLVGAVSRKTHTGVGAFDIPLIMPNTSPITSLNGIECRQITGTNGLAIVFSFDQPVNAGSAAVARDPGGVNPGGTLKVESTSFNNLTMTVNLSGLADKQKYTVTLTNIATTDASGTLAGPVAVTFETLQGDVNASGTYTGSDVNLIKAQIGVPVNAGNFRCDVNCNGLITGSDVNITKVKVSTTGFPIGTGATTNTAPTIAAINPPSVNNDGTSTPVGFAVGDAESDPNSLYVYANSSDQNLLPDGNIVLGGTGTSRTIAFTPSAGVTGTCTVTVTVTDGIAFTPTSFNLTVTDGTTLYIANLTPQAGAASTGAGSATLQVAGDQSYAILRFQYGNLSSPKNAEHIHFGTSAQNGPIIFDIDQPQPPSPVMQPLPDGSYKWVLADTGGITVAQQLAAIQAGNTYMNVHTANFPNGEIRGQFNLAQGSQTFTPPPAPPALPSGPATPADAVRFLQQGTFGATMADVNALVNDASGQALTAFSNWVDAQVLVPQTNVLNAVKVRVATTQAFTGSPAVGIGDQLSFNPTVIGSIYSAFINGPDQLRQRVAYAYSQIFVISDMDDNIDGHPAGLASYHDMLAADAFVNFRTILNDVTLHPMMGQYLTMRGNTGPNTLTSTTTPNENYAREILQLFSIGLNFLQPDGTLILDANGLPIPTYSQSTITSFAHVFTGWDARTSTSIPVLTSPASANVGESYIIPMTVSASSHSVITKNLLSYDPANANNYVTIAQNLSQSTTTANAELATALDNVFNHPNVGQFIARRLIQRLVCENPSPAYIYRVAQVFNNNGSGVRGDMKAVIKAILVDYEARSTTFLPNPSGGTPALQRGVIGYGKVREPVLRMTQVIRAFHPKSKVVVSPTAGVVTPVPSPFRLGVTDGGSMSQTAYRAPTVFNFYEPDFADAGIIASAGLVSPVMEIETETTTLEQHNTIYGGIFNSNVFTATFAYGWPGSDILIDLSVDDPANGATPNSEYSLAGSNATTAALVDRLNLLLMANQMPIQDTVVTTSTTPANNKTYLNMRQQIINYVNTLPLGTTGTTPANLTRARVALRLVVSSPQYNCQK